MEKLVCIIIAIVLIYAVLLLILGGIVMYGITVGALDIYTLEPVAKGLVMRCG